jgi:protocatechuate 3,4-dioxygenase beta subunit
MNRKSLIFGLLLLLTAACGGETVAPPTPIDASFSEDLLREREWEHYRESPTVFAELRGRIVGPDDQPIEGATAAVVITALRPELPPRITDRTTTDAKGEFTLRSVPGNAAVLPIHEGHAGPIIFARSLLEAEDELFTMKLSKGNVVTGTVRLPDGEPFADAPLFASSGFTGWFAELRTDADGRYRIDSAPPGPLQILVLPGGPVGDAGTIEVEAGVPLTVDFLTHTFPPIHGVVTDEATGEPIAGAMARVFLGEDHIVRTDAEGKFTLENVFGLGIQILSPGYAEQTVSVDPRRQDPVNVGIALSRGPSVSGLAVDQDGTPLSGARILMVTALSQTGVLVRGPLTDEEGKFTWSWIGGVTDDGRVVFGVETPDALPSLGEIVRLNPATRLDGLRLTRQPPASVSLRLVDSSGKPLVKALANLLPDVKGQPSGLHGILLMGDHGMTNRDGRTRMSGLRTGPHILTVNSKGRFPFQKTVVIEPGDTDLGDIVVDDLGILTGRIESTGGKLPKFIRASLGVEGSEESTELLVGEDGSFELRGLVDRKYILHVAANSHRPETFKFAGEAKDLVIRLRQLGTMLITPLCPEDPELDGRITLSQDIPGTTPVVRYFKGSGVEVKVERLNPGPWKVRLQSERWFGMAEVRVLSGQSESVEIRLRRSGTLYGTVRDPAGNPMAGVGIEYDGDDTWGRQGLPTDGEGKYRLVGLPAGKARIRCHHRGFAPNDFEIDLAEGAEIERDLVLDPGARLQVSVKDREGAAVRGVRVTLQQDGVERVRYWIDGDGRRPITDESGRLVFLGLVPGNYRVELYLNNELWDSRPVEVKKGGDPLELVLDK